MSKDAKKVTKSLSKVVWWSVVVTGAACITFGLVALFWPGLTVKTLTALFGIFVVGVGIVWLVESLSSMKTDKLWWLGALFAAVAIGLGFYSLTNPLLTMVIFALLVGLFVVAQGLIDFVIASYTPKGGRWPWVVSGVLGVVFGVLLLSHPKVASMAFVWVLGLYLVVHGGLSVVYAVRARGMVKGLKKGK